jgi:hypothetical protein
MKNSAPGPPAASLPEGDRRTALVGRVKSAIAALPFHFDSATVIEGVEAGDLFSLNSVLGSTIEVQTVAALNKLRDVWDPDGEYLNYAFKRSSHSFPDVRLVDAAAPDAEPLFGIELKGWYLLAKEKVPTFRYKVMPDACSVFDLLAVVPWYLNNVLSGRPVIAGPFTVNAKYAAMARNHYWSVMRGSSADKGIASPEGVGPYPRAGAEISDRPNRDGGGNFGRIARVEGLMDDYVASALQTAIAGVPAKYWIDFFTTFVDSHTDEDIGATVRERLTRASKEIGRGTEVDGAVDALADSIAKLLAAARTGEMA